MTEPDTPATAHQNRDIPAQIGAAVRLMLSGRHALGVVAGLAVVVVAGIVAPGDAPGWWAWARVLLVWLLASVALTSIAGATLDDRMPRTAPLLVWGSLLLAVAVSLTFTALSAALAVLILLVLLLIARPATRQPASFWLVIAVLAPLWVWSAFGTWDAWLLMVLPIGAVGTVAVEHAVRFRAGSNTSQRLASWVLTTGVAAALLLIALLGDIAPGWIAAAGLAAVLLAGVDLLLPGPVRARIPTAALPALALATLTLGWLVAL